MATTTNAANLEKITSQNILKRLKELEGHCSSQFGECAILLQKPNHKWVVPTEAQSKADPLLNKLREHAVVGARKLWGFLIDLLEPSLAAALRNKGVIEFESDNMCDAVSKLVIGLRDIAIGNASNITLKLATLHRLMGMKCEANTDPQVFLDQFLLLKTHIDLSDPRNMLSTSPEHAVMIAVNGLQTSIIGPQLLEKVSRDGIQADLSELVSDVTRLISLKKQIALAGGKPIVFVAYDTPEEMAALATDKEEKKIVKPVCEYCVKLGKTGTGHSTFLSNGGVRCRELAKDHLDGKVVTEEQCKACLDYVPKRRSNGKVLKRESKYSHLRYHTTKQADYNNSSSKASMKWTSDEQNAKEEEAYVDITAYVSRGFDKNIVVADTGATAHIFNNKGWFLSLNETPGAKVSGVGGAMNITHRGMTVFGQASFAEELPVSLLSTNQLHKERKEMKMEYSPKDNSFKVLLKGKWLEFKTSDKLNVLHKIMEPIGSTLKELGNSEQQMAYMAPESVDTQGNVSMSNDMILSKHQIDRAKAARRLHEALNHPGDAAMTRTLMRGHITDTHITAKDVALAEKIMGPCPACSTSKATTEIRGGQYHTADEVGQHLRCDIAFVGGRKAKTPFHFVVDEKCGYRGVEKLKTQTAASLHEAQMKQINFFRARGFNPTTLFYDDGANVHGTKHLLEAQRVRLKQWPPGQHEPMAEANARVLNTDMRSVIVSLPYQLPEALIPHLAVDVCNTRNTMCNNKSGMETPYMLVEGAKPSAHSFRIPFGAVCMVTSHDKNIASSTGRSAYGIVCGRDFGVMHKCSVYIIHSRTVVHAAVTDDDLVRQPYPGGIIQLINEISDNDYDVEDLVVGNGSEDRWQETPGSDIAANVIRRAADAHTRKRLIALRKKQDEAENTYEAKTATTEQHTDQTERVQVQTGAQATVTSDKKSTEQAPIIDNEDPYRRTYSGKSRSKRTRFEDEEQTDTTQGQKADTTDQAPQDSETHTTDTTEGNDIDVESDTENTVNEQTTAAKSTRSGRAYMGLRRTFEEIIADIAADDIGLKRMFVALLEDIAADDDNTRIGKEFPHEEQHEAWLMTLNGLLDLGPKGEAAVRKEIRAIIDHGSWKPVRHQDMTPTEMKESISSFVFGKEKLSGETKARLVKNGKQLQDRIEYKDLLSPTSNPMTTMHHLAVAGFERRRHLFAADFPNAYLKIDRTKHGMPKEYTRLTGKLARLVCEEQPEYRSYMHNGSLFLEILRSVYGLTESAALWFKELSTMLQQLGYERQEADPCLFIHPQHKSAVNIHVDDCMCSCTNDEAATKLKSFFAAHKCKIQQGEFLFLGMDVKQDEHLDVHLSMHTFLRDKLNSMGIEGTEKYPHKISLLDKEPSESLSEADKADYVSRVMCFMYAGLRTRFDVLYTLSCLSMHCQAPTNKNMDDLNHLLRYLNGTVNRTIKLTPSSMDIMAFVDASFMLHPDRKGHTGCVITLGMMGPCIGAKSSKQKMLVLSSTEGEVLAAFESIPLIRMASTLNRAFGYNDVPILHQDNKSAIEMMHAGGGSSKHTKHFDLRLRYIQDMIQDHSIEIQHLGTDDMPADHLSKTTTGNKYERCMKCLMGNTTD